MPVIKLAVHAKSSTLYGCMVVQLYIQIFSAWWVTTIFYNYGAKLCDLRYYLLSVVSLRIVVSFTDTARVGQLESVCQGV